ncbi:hypothetical protein DIPPA_21468 [Diplonema papillatum]|nr:hypothetical protein DIPPA_21468 [Diplonema papillatum]
MGQVPCGVDSTGARHVGQKNVSVRVRQWEGASNDRTEEAARYWQRAQAAPRKVVRHRMQKLSTTARFA